MATVDSDKVVCGGIHAMIVAVLVYFVKFVDRFQCQYWHLILDFNVNMFIKVKLSKEKANRMIRENHSRTGDKKSC
jgi:hypothetical protein